MTTIWYNILTKLCTCIFTSKIFDADCPPLSMFLCFYYGHLVLFSLINIVYSTQRIKHAVSEYAKPEPSKRFFAHHIQFVWLNCTHGVKKFFFLKFMRFHYTTRLSLTQEPLNKGIMKFTIWVKAFLFIRFLSNMPEKRADSFNWNPAFSFYGYI